jgi:hypothetical protein
MCFIFEILIVNFLYQLIVLYFISVELYIDIPLMQGQNNHTSKYK